MMRLRSGRTAPTSSRPSRGPCAVVPVAVSPAAALSSTASLVDSCSSARSAYTSVALYAPSRLVSTLTAARLPPRSRGSSSCLVTEPRISGAV